MFQNAITNEDATRIVNPDTFVDLTFCQISDINLNEIIKRYLHDDANLNKEKLQSLKELKSFYKIFNNKLLDKIQDEIDKLHLSDLKHQDVFIESIHPNTLVNISKANKLSKIARGTIKVHINKYESSDGKMINLKKFAHWVKNTNSKKYEFLKTSYTK